MEQTTTISKLVCTNNLFINSEITGMEVANAVGVVKKGVRTRYVERRFIIAWLLFRKYS